MQITVNNRDFTRLGSYYIHAVGQNPAREVVIGPGDTKILDVFDGGENITLMCVASIVEEFPPEEGGFAGQMRNKPHGILDKWPNPNLPPVPVVGAEGEQPKDKPVQGREATNKSADRPRTSFVSSSSDK